MITVLDTLKAISNYPIPARVFQTGTVIHRINPGDEATVEKLESEGYLRAKADVLLFLSMAPTISEQGVSYSFGETEKAAFKKEANKIIAGIEKKPVNGYGYFGGSL